MLKFSLVINPIANGEHAFQIYASEAQDKSEVIEQLSLNSKWSKVTLLGLFSDCLGTTSVVSFYVFFLFLQSLHVFAASYSLFVSLSLKLYFPLHALPSRYAHCLLPTNLVAIVKYQ